MVSEGDGTMSRQLQENSIHIKNRDRGCLKCGSTDDLTVDHVIPKSKGGGNNWKNLQTLCSECNQEKAELVIDYRSRERTLIVRHGCSLCKDKEGFLRILMTRAFCINCIEAMDKSEPVLWQFLTKEK